MHAIRILWRALGVDVAVLVAMLAVVLSHPEQWAAFLCDWVLAP